MGIFDLFKKVLSPGKSSNAQNISFTETIDGKTKKIPVQDTVKDVFFSADFEHLTKDGELPWGWYAHNKEKDIVDKIGSEHTYFLNMWLDSRNKSPKEQYAPLKSFVLFLEDAEKLCTQKNECVEFWFYNIIASKDYIEQRKKELQHLVENFDSLQKQYEERQYELLYLDESIIKKLKENQGVLQSDFVKTFNPVIQNDVKERLYQLEKAGKLQRTKSGRSYILNYRG